MERVYCGADASKSATKAGSPESSSHSHISSQVLTIPGSFLRPETESITTSAFRAAPAAATRISLIPSASKLQFLFKPHIQQTHKFLTEPPSANAHSEIFVDQHRFYERLDLPTFRN